MTEEQIRARAEKLLSEESSEPEQWFWLSFADETGFLGGCYVRAQGIITAIRVAHDRGINPGGQVRCVDCGLDEEIKPEILAKIEEVSYKLLSKAEVEAL